MRKIFIGDVHGCFDELLDLLKVLNYNHKKDTLYFVGDLINKGPKSKEVLDFVINDKSKVILGNHELALLTSATYDHLFERYIPYLKQLPLYIEEDDFLMVHAGLVPEKKVYETKPFFLTSIRTWDGAGIDLNNKNDPPWYHFYNDQKLIIYGHWAKQGLNILKNVIGIDSGCVWGGKLTALVLPGRKVYQVDAKRAYQNI